MNGAIKHDAATMFIGIYDAFALLSGSFDSKNKFVVSFNDINLTQFPPAPTKFKTSFERLENENLFSTFQSELFYKCQAFHASQQLFFLHKAYFRRAQIGRQ